MEGFTRATGEPLFLGFFDTAYNMEIDTIWQKYTFRQKSGVSKIVYSGKVKRKRILWILAERYVILSENAVRKWEIAKAGYNLEKSHTIWQKSVVSPNCIGVSPNSVWRIDKKNMGK